LFNKRKEMNTKSQICPKCHGAGKLDWTSEDGGICYKCEGQGYLGEMPEGFSKIDKEVRREAKDMLKRSLINKRTHGDTE
jgi:DnaJ-class molecular chaperone